jgi:hypothetical protein
MLGAAAEVQAAGLPRREPRARPPCLPGPARGAHLCHSRRYTPSSRSTKAGAWHSREESIALRSPARSCASLATSPAWRTASCTYLRGGGAGGGGGGRAGVSGAVGRRQAAASPCSRAAAGGRGLAQAPGRQQPRQPRQPRQQRRGRRGRSLLVGGRDPVVPDAHGGQQADAHVVRVAGACGRRQRARRHARERSGGGAAAAAPALPDTAQAAQHSQPGAGATRGRSVLPLPHPPA